MYIFLDFDGVLKPVMQGSYSLSGASVLDRPVKHDINFLMSIPFD